MFFVSNIMMVFILSNISFEKRNVHLLESVLVASQKLFVAGEDFLKGTNWNKASNILTFHSWFILHLPQRSDYTNMLM